MPKKDIYYIYSEEFIFPSNNLSEEKIKELFNQKMYSIILKIEDSITLDDE